MTRMLGERRQVFLDSVDSTNKEAARRLAGGDRGPIWIAAREQTDGRGRSGRKWKSSAGNFAATLLFPFEGGAGEAPRLGFVAALAVAATIEELAAGKAVRLKWPNDVLLEDQKVSGILLESFGANRDGSLAVAIGIGINLAAHPPSGETRWPATSIKAQTGNAPEPEDTLGILDRHIDQWMTVLAMDGFARICSAWMAQAAHLGQIVTISTPQGQRRGRFTKLDPDGALVLETRDGSETFAAGDVTLGEAGLAASD